MRRDNKRTLMKRNILLCLAILMLPVTAGAMTPIDDHELSNMTGQAGVTIYYGCDDEQHL